ncbi:hypothetical protein RRG08_027999 [Elysia crispata]|uniref:Uncharacterized protein n=1 Tax=Elysia crispata TaxID=231223 RepID=A0AAE1BBG1_9GAST|nr:hypothetical protein RRG08_027999 [Elysia crispata]
MTKSKAGLATGRYHLPASDSISRRTATDASRLVREQPETFNTKHNSEHVTGRSERWRTILTKYPIPSRPRWYIDFPPAAVTLCISRATKDNNVTRLSMSTPN